MIRNIEDKFLRAGTDCIIESDWGRIYLHTDDEGLGIRLLTTIFGIISVSPVITTSSDISEITQKVVEYGKTLLTSKQTFALRTRRTGTHKYTSMDLARHLGSVILDRFNDLELKVDLSAPDVEIFVEVRNNRAFVFSESYPGPGGLPLSTQGKVVSIFTDQYSYIAAWLMMKRGCRTYPVYFRANSKNGENRQEEDALITDQIEALRTWTPNIGLKIIEVSTTEERSADMTNNYDIIDLNNEEFLNYMRYVRVKGICIGIDLENFKKFTNSHTGTLPIYYPLIGLKENMIKDLEFKILGKKTN